MSDESQAHFLRGQIAGEERILLLLGFDKEDTAIDTLTAYRKLADLAEFYFKYVPLEEIGAWFTKIENENYDTKIPAQLAICRKLDPEG